MNYKYDPILMMNVPEEGTKTQDASRGHEIIVKTENYLKSIGKNNTVDSSVSDYSKGQDCMNRLRNIERHLDEARSNCLKDLGTVKRDIDGVLEEFEKNPTKENPTFIKALVAEFDRLYKKINA